MIVDESQATSVIADEAFGGYNVSVNRISTIAPGSPA